jgi:AcrR family transcriptional regulator
MTTKSKIIQIGDALIREKGYNGFSFSDISKQLNIRNASVHYHFPTKTDLGVAIVQKHITGLEHLIGLNADRDPLQKLHAFLSIYENIKSEDKICLVGTLATDLSTVDSEVRLALKILVDRILQWVIQFLEEGKAIGQFHFNTSTKTKALMITTNMLASLQITRITGYEDFLAIKQAIINDLTLQPL